jgi:hypothetical protein
MSWGHCREGALQPDSLPLVTVTSFEGLNTATSFLSPNHTDLPTRISHSINPQVSTHKYHATRIAVRDTHTISFSSREQCVQDQASNSSAAAPAPSTPGHWIKKTPAAWAAHHLNSRD